MRRMRSSRVVMFLVCVACSAEQPIDRDRLHGANTDPSNCTAVTNVALVPGPGGPQVVETTFRDVFPYDEIGAYVRGETAGVLMDVRHQVDDESGETTATVVFYDQVGWSFPIPADAGP